MPRAPQFPLTVDHTNLVRYFLVIAAIAFLVHVVIIIVFPEYKLKHDSLQFHQMAVNLLDGNGFAYEQQGEMRPSIVRGPGYPLIIAALYTVFGRRQLPVFLLQVLFTFTASWILLNFNSKRFGPGIALAASSLLLFDLRVLSAEHMLLTEITYLLGITSLVVMLESAHGKSLRYFIGAGLLTGYVTLVKTRIALFPLVFAVYWLTRRDDKKKQLTQVILYFLAAAVVVCPWTVRNYIVFDEFIPVTSGAGASFYMGNYYETKGRWGKDLPDDFEEISASTETVHEKNGAFLKKAFQKIREHPGETLKMWAIKFLRFWTEDFWTLKPSVANSQYKQVVFIGYIWKFIEFLVFIFFVIGILKCYRMLPVVTMLVLYFTAIHTIIHAISRYRIPIIPFVWTIAAFGLLETYRFARGRLAARSQ